jgi:eukaryotic-like serine/threonine-protein kinase
MTPANGITLGLRYQLEYRIGSGGYSEVWRAHDTVLDRPVAIKLLHAARARSEEAVVRFRNEAQLAGRLSHVNVARVYDFCDSYQGVPPYLVMELIDGPSLSQVIDHGPLHPARTMDVLAQAASGLQAAHAAGLVHRDIKPTNLMLAPGGVLKITDFGLSHTLGSAPITGTGLLIGTPAYFAPERAGGARATPAGDLYSLGVVGYECLTGDVPFTGTPLEVAAAHRERTFPPLPATVPPAIAQFIAQLTAKDPAARPASAEAAAWQAAHLRDQQSGLPPADQNLRPSAPGGWSPAAAGFGADVPRGAGANHPTTVTQRPPEELRQTAPRRRRAGLVAACVAALAIAITAGVAFAQAGGGSGTARKPAADPHTSAPAVRLVDVQRGALIGEPTRLAVRQLRAEGFRVRVRQDQTWSEPPGHVVAVTPAGPQPAGSLVTIVSATWPYGYGFGFGHHHHHHFGGGGNGGNGFGGNGFGGDTQNG